MAHNKVWWQGPARLQGHAWDVTWLESYGGRKHLLEKTLLLMSYLVFIKDVYSLSVKGHASQKSYFKKLLGNPSARVIIIYPKKQIHSP